ncbi:hypothetical protein [Kitasatospora sp. NPDC002040]|uniref:hypothetical protein n=1 Tax=Kitasatospora sp. NPDC002040 TaxID=3154661 RepID=UPI0033243411
MIHAMCDGCWVVGPGQLDPKNKSVHLDMVKLPPVPEGPRTVERCCFCWAPTVAGIRVPHDPAAPMPVCEGVAGYHSGARGAGDPTTTDPESLAQDAEFGAPEYDDTDTSGPRVIMATL